MEAVAVATRAVDSVTWLGIAQVAVAIVEAVVEEIVSSAANEATWLGTVPARMPAAVEAATVTGGLAVAVQTSATTVANQDTLLESAPTKTNFIWSSLFYHLNILNIIFFPVCFPTLLVGYKHPLLAFQNLLFHKWLIRNIAVCS